MNIPSHIQPFWEKFVATVGYDGSSRFYEAFHFDDNERDANALPELLWIFEAHNRPIPQQGDLSVVTSWDGQPLCVMQRVSDS